MSEEIEISFEETVNVLKDSKGLQIHADLFFPNDESVSKERILKIKESRKVSSCETKISSKGKKYITSYKRKNDR